MRRQTYWWRLLITACLFLLAASSAQADIDPAVVQKLLADDKAAEDAFGYKVSVNGDTAVIGVPNADPDSLSEAGAAYIFIRSDGIWTQQAKLTASDKAAEDWFGIGVSVSGDTVVIGASLADPDSLEDAGAAYVFTRSDGIWIQQAKLTADDKAGYDCFGASISVSGETAMIGAPSADPDSLSGAGAVYIFTRSDDGIWTQQTKLTAGDKTAEDQFGISMSVDGDTAVIGSPSADPNSLPYAGAAYVFTRSDGTWTQQAKLTADDKAENDRFGGAVDVDGDTAVIGAPSADPDGLSSAGAAYVYDVSATIKDMPWIRVLLL